MTTSCATGWLDDAWSFALGEEVQCRLHMVGRELDILSHRQPGSRQKSVPDCLVKCQPYGNRVIQHHVVLPDDRPLPVAPQSDKTRWEDLELGTKGFSGILPDEMVECVPLGLDFGGLLSRPKPTKAAI
jgi:hypothetical protein